MHACFPQSTPKTLECIIASGNQNFILFCKTVVNFRLSTGKVFTRAPSTSCPQSCSALWTNYVSTYKMPCSLYLDTMLLSGKHPCPLSPALSSLLSQSGLCIWDLCQVFPQSVCLHPECSIPSTNSPTPSPCLPPSLPPNTHNLPPTHIPPSHECC